MLSAFPATAPSDTMFGTHFPSFENGFTPWDVEPSSDIFSLINSSKPVVSSSGSDDKPNRNQANSNSSSEDHHPNKAVPVIDERKRRRMISNRESARRSRMRKQKHLENLRNQVNRLRIENRELSNRLRLVMYNGHRIRTDNDRLRSEQIMLRQKLSNIRHILLLQELQQSTSAWPSNNNVNVTSLQSQSLIT